MTLAGDMTLAAAYTTASRCSPSAVLDVSVRCRKGQETSVAVMGVAVVVVVVDASQCTGKQLWTLLAPGIHAAAPTAAWSDLLHLMQISPSPYR